MATRKLTREALRHKIARKERVGKVRYGFNLGPDGKTLIADPAEQDAVALMYQLRDGGYSLRRIAAELDARHILPREAHHWNHNTVAYILKTRKCRLADCEACGGDAVRLQDP